MSTEKENDMEELVENLVEYEEEEDTEAVAKDADKANIRKGHYVGIHASGFKDFLLKPALLRAIVDCGFETPSQVQDGTIPQAILGMDILCQAKAGMGKTAVFVLATLHQLVPEDGVVSVLCIGHTRELAFQIAKEYDRFSKYMDGVRCGVFFGGIPFRKHKELIESECPHIVVGCPGRILHLVEEKVLNLSQVKHFVVDECDEIFEKIDMRRKVQKIYMATPTNKQVMMFSATMTEDILKVCRKFLTNPIEFLAGDDTKLTLHGLKQYYLKVAENEKNRKLNDLIDALNFNQLIIFVSKVKRAHILDKLLRECNFPSICVTGMMNQEDRTAAFKDFKEFKTRILVSTDLMGRGIDVERVNVVINYDFPASTTDYIHRVGRAGRFGTKGLAISFVSSKEDAAELENVQTHFKVDIPELPDEIDEATYTS